MAKVKLDPVLAGISGRMGDLVFRTAKDGTVTVSQRPRKSNVSPSPAQQAQRQRFAAASKYAQEVLTNPDLRAVYEEMAADAKISPFAAARNDYFAGNNLLAKK